MEKDFWELFSSLRIMSIYTTQNSKRNLQLLGAYSTLYSNAKSIMGSRIFISVLVTIIGTLVALWIPSTQTIVGAVGGSWALISEMFLKSLEKRKIKEAATVQEEFDTSLFELSWNQSLVGNKIAPEIIISSNRLFKGDRNKHKNWYPSPGNSKRPLDVLLCQRSCVVWDWRLRKLFMNSVVAFVVLLLVAEIIFAFYFNLTVLRFILTLLLPSSSIFLIAYEVIKDNFELLSLRQRMEDKISKLLNLNKNTGRTVTVKSCRELQDDLFRLRSTGALVPNWFYMLFRDNFETDMKSATKSLIKPS